MLVRQHIVQKQGPCLAAHGTTESLHEVPNFPTRSMACRSRLPCLWSLPPQEQVRGMGNSEAVWVTIFMLFGGPP